MTLNNRTAIQFCGFGGQGVVLSSIIFGTAGAIGAGLFAVQTQSYGSEARGGECQAEVILSPEPIGSPLADRIDILVAMSQMAFDRYITRLQPGGILIVDPDMVHPGERTDITVYQVPAGRSAEHVGSKIAANMVMLGFLQHITGFVSEESLKDAIRENVKPSFLETNLKAAALGVQLARQAKAAQEV